MLLKNIETIQVGDMVQTHTGKWQRVEETMCRQYTGRLLTIKPRGNFDVTLTPEHPILCIPDPIRERPPLPVGRRPRGSESIPLAEELDHGIYRQRGTASWIQASDVQVGDIVLEAIDQCVELPPSVDLLDYINPSRLSTGVGATDGRSRKSQLVVTNRAIRFAHQSSRDMDRHIPVTIDFCRFLGYYIAEGNVAHHSIRFSFHIKETDFIEDVCRIGEDLFGITPNLSYAGKVCNITFNSLILKDFFEQFGDKAHNKSIPTWIAHLPRPHQLEFFRGAWRGDGCTSDGGFVYTSSSMRLIVGLRMMLYRLGVVPGLSTSRPNGSINEFSGGRKVYSRPLHNLTIRGKNATILAELLEVADPSAGSTDFFYDHIINGYVHRRVAQITESEYSGPVYNLHVAVDNSYQTNSFIVHNCSGAFIRVAIYGGEVADPVLVGVPNQPDGAPPDWANLMLGGMDPLRVLATRSGGGFSNGFF